MNSIDDFMQTEFFSFYQRAIAAFQKNHGAIFATFSHLMPEKIKMGMRITDHGTPIGDYTLILEKGKIAQIQNGILDAEFNTPFGVIKPYYMIEKSCLEKMIQDEQAFLDHPFATKIKYIPDITIKFLR